MPLKATRAATSASQALQHVWIGDNLLEEAWARFLRVSLTHRRYGSTVPGPLEARRRTDKRRHGMVSVGGGGVPHGFDVAALFGLSQGTATRPDFERQLSWKPPSLVSSFAPAPAKKDNGDWRPWMRPAKKEEWGASAQAGEDLLAQQTYGDSGCTGKEEFVALLDSYNEHDTIDETLLRPVLDVLQSAANNPNDELTLRLVEWLADRNLTPPGANELAKVIAQKIALATMASSEASAILVTLLQRRPDREMVASILDSLTWPMACTIVNKSTSVVLNISTSERQSLVNAWLDCVSASSIATREPHSRSELWSTVYSQLSEHFRLSDLAEHFNSLDQKELAKCLLQHWAPKLSALPTETHVRHATLPQDIDWKIRFNRQQHHNPDQGFDEALNDSDFNHPLTDLISTLVAHNIPYETLMGDIYRYWQKTENPMFIADRTFEICGNQPRIAIPSTTTTALVRTFLDNGATEAAWHVVDAAGPMPAFPASSFREFVMDYVQKSRHWIIPWRMIDRWADEDEASPAAHPINRKLISPELVSFVQDIAYAWAQSPLITPRTAYRHVWECYRFLNDYNIPVSRLLCRAFLRAGVVRYIEARQTLAKTQVHFVLSIVGKLEGKHVQERLDKMVYDYWNTYRRFAKVKPAEQLFQEKWLGLRVAPDGTKTFRKWKPRVRRKVSAALLREKALFDEGMAVQPTAPEGVDAPPELAVEAEIKRPDSLLMTLKTAVQDFTGDTQRMEREAFESRETDPEADNPFRPVSDEVRSVGVGKVIPFQPFAGGAVEEGQPGSPMLSPPRPRRQLRQRTYDVHDEDLSQATTVQSIHAKETNAAAEQRASFPVEVGDAEPAAVEVEAAPPASVDLSLEQLKLRTYELELELAGLQHKLDIRQEAESGSTGSSSLDTSGIEEQTWMKTLGTDANRSADTSV